MANNNETHEKAVEHAACYLIENGISTRAGPGRGIDLILDSGKTILVRGMNDEPAIALMNGSLDTLKADYVVAVTRLRYRCSKKVYIMSMDIAKYIAGNNPYQETGRNDWFITQEAYHTYRDNTEVLK